VIVESSSALTVSFGGITLDQVLMGTASSAVSSSWPSAISAGLVAVLFLAGSILQNKSLVMASLAVVSTWASASIANSITSVLIALVTRVSWWAQALFTVLGSGQNMWCGTSSATIDGSIMAVGAALVANNA